MTTLFPTTRTTPPRTETVNGHAFRMIPLPTGRFEMGNNDGEEDSRENEKPRHWVEVPAFELAEFPVTQALWAAVRAAAAPGAWEKRELPADPSYFMSARRPVEQVSWWEATAFCEILSERTGRTYRLPTEAEWEYAARCGRRDHLYSGSNALDEVGWYDGNNNTETMPVGLLAPNDWGLYDMSGNVWEWCADHWHEDYNGAPEDGSAWLTEDESAGRVQRGGSWIILARDCRSAIRDWIHPGDRDFILGFRLAASLVQDPSRPPLPKGEEG